MLECLTSFQKSLLIGIPLEYLLVYTSRFHIAQVAFELTKLSGDAFKGLGALGNDQLCVSTAY